MAAPLKAGIPPGLDLGQGFTIQFTALAATTGAVVSGVNVSNASLLVDNVGSVDNQSLIAGPFLLVPGPSH